MSSLLSRTLHGLLVLSGIPGRRRRRNRAPVFCFHNVVAPGQGPVGDASLHIDVTHFASLLEWIASEYTVVPLAGLSHRIADGRSVAGLAALTFDDGCLGVYRHAAPLLREAGLPATVFAVPEAADRGEPYWWDRLAARGALDPAVRDRCLEELRGEGEAVEAALLGDPDAPPLPDDARPAPWEVLLAGVSDGLALESHTLSHPNLTRLSPPEVERELVESARRLRERTDRPPTQLAYPYGLADRRVARAAAAAGYRAAWTVEPRPAGPGDGPWLLPRVNVPAGIAPSVLACWATGIRLR